jgi:hypothetical protein
MWVEQYIPEYEKFVDKIVWVKDYAEFVDYITISGLPDKIFFDHDLGNSQAPTGHDAAKWLVNYCMENNLDLPRWSIQSANPVGITNINSLLSNYKKFRKENL